MKESISPLKLSRIPFNGIITDCPRGHKDATAIAFAVLLMNMCVPLLDYYTQPRVYGHKIDSNDEE